MISSLQNVKRLLVPIISLALLYFLSGKLSLLFLHGNNIVNIGIFAAEGIALAFVLFFGRAIWPGIFVGQLLLAYSNSISIEGSFLIAAINSFEAVFGYMLFQKFKLNINLKRFQDIFGLVFIIFTIQLISAIPSNIVLVLQEVITPQDFLESSLSWWSGNVLGQLLITPFLLLLFTHYKKINMGEYVTYGLLFGLFTYLLEVVFNIQNTMILLTLSIPVVVFIISTKGFVFGTHLSVVVAIVSSYSVYKGVGPFYLEDTLENVINYNLFVLAHISTVFMTGVLFEERREYLTLLEDDISKEISKNKEQQLLLLKQSRLAQMGEMIAMIAHQWRQPLNNLSLVNQLLVTKYRNGKLDDALIEDFKVNSQKQINLMSRTIDDFRNFFKAKKKKEYYSITKIIEDMLNITKAISETYSIKTTFNAEDEFYSYGYPNELGQAIINILNNAKDALVENEIMDKEIKINVTKEKDKIKITIEDNAGGIPEDIVEKIFDPYFSTKQSKNGTGLGLYMSTIIVQEQLQGEMKFNNGENGAVFTIILKEERNAS